MTYQSNQSDEMLFNINQVAKILDVVPATIRNWEKNGLFIAKRKNNNYRVFSLDDIDQLKIIRTYSINQKMGTNAIKNILMSGLTKPPMFSSVDPSEVQTKYSKKLLSGKWLESRNNLNLTLEEVGANIGISTSYLSKIENGQANISFDILNKLANFYGESILYFFEQESIDSKIVRNKQGEVVEVGLPGVRMESLIAQKHHVLFPVLFTIEPDCGSTETHRHHGEEFIYVIHGKLEVTLNYDEVYPIKKGDSIYFKSFEYHSWTNTGKKPAMILWVHSPVETLS